MTSQTPPSGLDCTDEMVVSTLGLVERGDESRTLAAADGINARNPGRDPGQLSNTSDCGND